MRVHLCYLNSTILLCWGSFRIYIYIYTHTHIRTIELGYNTAICVTPRLKRYTDTRRLTTGILSEKCVVRRFCLFVNIMQCTYTNLDSIAYYTPRLYEIAYCC